MKKFLLVSLCTTVFFGINGMKVINWGDGVIGYAPSRQELMVSFGPKNCLTLIKRGEDFYGINVAGKARETSDIGTITLGLSNDVAKELYIYYEKLFFAVKSSLFSPQNESYQAPTNVKNGMDPLIGDLIKSFNELPAVTDSYSLGHKSLDQLTIKKARKNKGKAVKNLNDHTSKKFSESFSEKLVDLGRAAGVQIFKIEKLDGTIIFEEK